MSEYTAAEANLLLSIARDTLETITRDSRFQRVVIDSSVILNRVMVDELSSSLLEPRACFITLEMLKSGQLRGCTGTLQARLPLVEEVIQSTYHTAFFDPRFLPVSADETPNIRIEISILTPSRPLPYTDVRDLIEKLHPGVDGVTLIYGMKRATFLPQVWERFAVPELFLNALCQKMGMPPDSWRTHKFGVETYTAIKIVESD